MVGKFREKYAVSKRGAQILFYWEIFNLRILNELEVENNISEITNNFEDMEYLSDDDVNRARENTRDNIKPQLKKFYYIQAKALWTI
jgi:hypothetical protein